MKIFYLMQAADIEEGTNKVRTRKVINPYDLQGIKKVHFRFRAWTLLVITLIQA